MADDVYHKLKTYFEENKVAFREVTHAPGASAQDYHNALGCRWEQQAKSLLIKVYTDAGDYYAMLVIPAQKRADLETIKNLLNAKKVRMSNLDELKKVTGLSFGEVPPVGKIFDIKLLLDKEFLREAEIYLSAGRVDVSFIVSPKDLVTLENPIMV